MGKGAANTSMRVRNGQTKVLTFKAGAKSGAMHFEKEKRREECKCHALDGMGSMTPSNPSGSQRTRLVKLPMFVAYADSMARSERHKSGMSLFAIRVREWPSVQGPVRLRLS